MQTIKDFTVLKGNLLVELEDQFGDGMVGEIYLPTIRKYYHASVGRIRQANLRDIDIQHLGMTGGELIGYRALMDISAGRPVEGQHYVYSALLPLTERGDGVMRYKPSILALITDDTPVEVVDEVPRCKFCGDAKSGSGTTIMLVARRPGGGPKKYACPRCKRDQTGSKVDWI